MTAGLGENQDTKDNRIKSFKKGYIKGQPDLIIQNLHKHSQCNGIITDQQMQLIERYEEKNWKNIIFAYDDYDEYFESINDKDFLYKTKMKNLSGESTKARMTTLQSAVK